MALRWRRLKRPNVRWCGWSSMPATTPIILVNYRVLNKNKRQKFRVAPRSSRLANDGKDGAILLSLRGSKIRFGNLRFEE